MSWVRNVAAAAAAIIAFFLLSTPVVNSDLGTRTMSQLQSNIIYKLMPKDSNIVPAEPIEDTLKAVPVKTVTAQQPAEIKETPKEKTPTLKTTYYVIVASQVKKSNAELYVEKLQKNGFSQAEVIVHHKVVRVAVGQYATEEEAYRMANQLHQKAGFEGAWVYKQKVGTTNRQAEI
jgi:cell division septation protein DedD